MLIFECGCALVRLQLIEYSAEVSDVKGGPCGFDTFLTCHHHRIQTINHNKNRIHACSVQGSVCFCIFNIECPYECDNKYGNAK